MTDTGPTIGLVLDCHDPATLAAFCSAALDYVNASATAALARPDHVLRSSTHIRGEQWGRGDQLR